MAEKYTYADVIIDPEDPRVEIGKEYYAATSISGALRAANEKNEGLLANLDSVNREPTRTLITSKPFTISYKHGNGGEADFLIRKKEYTENDIITDVSDPRLKDAIGKTVYVAHKLYGSIVDNANNNDSANKGVLVNLGYDPSHPFEVHTELGLHWDRIILSKNQPPRKKYVPFDLTKEEDRTKLRGAWVRHKQNPERENLITGLGDETVDFAVYFGDVAIGTGVLLENFEFVDGSPCGKLVEEE